jgi:2-(1,2-epoxy-1,2-dihydrophenyl)acetyl-CoA isomerase
MMIREERRGATAIITLNYPQRRNALAVQMRAELVEALDRIEADASLRAVVLTGEGGHFSAGGDISGMNVADLAAGRERFRLTHRLVRMMVESAKPFIAAVEGFAVGAGLGVALCCDTIISGADGRFMAGFGKIGLVADFGLLHTLPLRIGQGRARQMLIHGDMLDAATAERIGLIDQMVPDGTALEAALAKAAALADAAPLPIAMTKSFLAQGLAEALEWERNTQSTLFLTADHAEGKDAFLSRRAPKFSGV